MKCTHETRRRETECWGECMYTGEMVYKDVWVTTSTFVDTGLHTYCCTQCGHVGYYSERARAFFEDGKGELP